MDLRPGELVGRYTLVEPLGEGGQGSVWKIVDPQSATVRALKLLDLRRLPPSAAARARLEVDAVARAAAHPSIAPCHDVVTLPDGRLGLVFELVRGQPLADLLQDARMTADHRLALLEQLASALAHIHECGIVHRDLKPENVLVAEGFWRAPRGAGHVKLVDFGIASIMHGETGLTAVGNFVGTVPYLAPEVLSPKRWARVPTGYTRDVFAFGVLAWELLHGRHPTGLPWDAPAKAFATVYEGASAPARWPPPGAVGPVTEVVEACLAADPAQRLADGDAIAKALRQALEMPGISARAGNTKPHRNPTDVSGVASSRAPTSSSAPPMSAHGPSSREATVPLTTPMPLSTAAWAYPRSSPIEPPPKHTKQTREPRPRSSLAWFGLIVTITLCLVLAAGYLFTTAGTESGQPARQPSPSPRTASPDPQWNKRVPFPLPCCAENGSCKSKRACAPSPCTPTRIPEGWSYLRLTGAASGRFPSFPNDLAHTNPASRVCLRRPPDEEWVCATATRMAASDDGDRDNRLRVLTSDLEQGRIEIWIKDGDRTLARDYGAPNLGGIRTSALCSGFRLYVGRKDSATYYVHGYIDDEGS